MNNDPKQENNTNTALMAEKLYALLLRCSHTLIRGHRHKRDRHPGQMRILLHLKANGKMIQSDLLDVLQIRAASLSEILTKLENKDLIVRKKDESDKRVVSIELTELGEKFISETVSEHQEITADMFTVLSEEEQNQLASILSKLIEKWHENDEKDDNAKGFRHRDQGDRPFDQGRGFFGHENGRHGHNHDHK